MVVHLVDAVRDNTAVEEDIDKRALEVFTKCLEMLGGPRRLFEYKRLTWLPSLMEAAYVVIYHNEYMKNAGEIASVLGISTATVRNILSADEELVKHRIQRELAETNKRLRTHTAGGLAKLAYKALKSEGK